MKKSKHRLGSGGNYTTIKPFEPRSPRDQRPHISRAERRTLVEGLLKEPNGDPFLVEPLNTAKPGYNSEGAYDPTQGMGLRSHDAAMVARAERQAAKQRKQEARRLYIEERQRRAQREQEGDS